MYFTVHPCTPYVEFTYGSTLPAIVEAIHIKAKTSVTVLSGQTVHFKATDAVTLEPGFSANYNSNFVADIARCGESSAARMTVSSTNAKAAIRRTQYAKFYFATFYFFRIDNQISAKVLLFQTINFIKGSEQKAHSDTVHMTTYPLGNLITVWIAFGVDFYAKKGDVFIWHANLIHGGNLMLDKNATRKSMVIHYFCEDVICYHEITERPALFDSFPKSTVQVYDED